MAQSEAFRKLMAAEDQVISILSPRLEQLITDHSLAMITAYDELGTLPTATPQQARALADVLASPLGAVFETAPQLLVDSGTKASTRQIIDEYLTIYGLERGFLLSETTSKQLTRLIVAGQRRGLSQAEIIKRLRSTLPKIAGMRASSIATTEVHSASQYAAWRNALASPVVTTKQWETREDELVRDFSNGSDFSHRAVNNVKVGAEANFLIPTAYGTFERLRFAGDPTGSAGNIINCRCATHYKGA